MVHDRAEPAGDRASRSTSAGPTRTASTRSSTSTSRPATEGDCLARYLLRIDEIKQSLRIIDQCLHQMPDGPVMAKLPRLLRPRPGRAYAAVEGPRGQYATYAISDGTDQPFRMRIHDPCFIHLQAVGLLMPGNLIADTMAIMASPRPDHGRRRQVTVDQPRSWGRLTLPGKVIFTARPAAAGR